MYELKKRINVNEGNTEKMKRDWQRKDSAWKEREEMLIEKMRKDMKRMEERSRKMENKIGEKRKCGGSKSELSEREEWQSDKYSESEEKGRENKVKVKSEEHKQAASTQWKQMQGINDKGRHEVEGGY